MVIDYLSVFRRTVAPHKANAPLTVDPDRMLASSFALQLLQPVSRWSPEIFKLVCRIQDQQFPARLAFDAPKSRHILVSKQSLSSGVPKRSNHAEGYSIVGNTARRIRESPAAEMRLAQVKDAASART